MSIAWTPNEVWLFAELAMRSLLVSVDGGEPARLPARDAVEEEGERVRGELHASNDAIRLSLRLFAERASVTLAPVRFKGNAWRDGWGLELMRTRSVDGERESWTLTPGSEPAHIDDARVAPVVVELRVPRRALVRHGETVPLSDVAFHRFTRQSSRRDAPPDAEVAPSLAWSRPTSAEAAPWWEVDLGKGMLVALLRVELASAPAGARVTVQAFAFSAKGGSPPPDAFARTFEVDQLSRGPDGHVAFEIYGETVARIVRVSLALRGEPVSLHVTALCALAADLVAASLRETMRRTAPADGDEDAPLSVSCCGMVMR
jgi:hypothetical protein